MKTIRALHIASFNGNIGDNANHNGFRTRLKETLGCHVEYEEIEMREFYKSWAIRDFNSEDFVDACNSVDLVIIGGGNFFELKWDYSFTGTTINISEESLDKIKTPILFHGVGCDIAKGASESTVIKFESFLKKILNNKKNLISVRNDGSYETINKLYDGKYIEQIYKVPDGAFFFESKQFDFPELNSNYRSIGINVVSDMKDIRFNGKSENGIEYEEFIEKFAEEINVFLYNNIEYQIILFPHIYSDLQAINDLLEKIDDRLRRTKIVIASCLTGSGSEEYIFGLYKQCEFILGMRFHSNVCSIAQEIPTIGMSSYKKIVDLYDEINLSDRVVEVNKRGFQNELREQIHYTINNIDEIKLRYKKANQKIYIESKYFYEGVKDWYTNLDLV
ncbi:polysaccharide pyruvyl transferase family protein [Pseudalkalibacillus hwajinpoensis]|uniref:Polysaccharide pyruvyl transferase family protein n=1 Tax=Guptibacillus hwajinpoensis TaxID=208199 RepID=A0A4U1MJ42_9BACL|nr:polysaccharide pyruvyl transferase family protein [Pseudalkalibacillus hwajinpoensis]TKD70741.1 polysaccharide pyruvyl transferase family protein [Pseudalkalibacillus hwajinpoensis]